MEYEVARAEFPEFYNNYSLENWIGFLMQWQLIANSENGLNITDAGREFLVYLTYHQLPENKPL